MVKYKMRRVSFKAGEEIDIPEGSINVGYEEGAQGTNIIFLEPTSPLTQPPPQFLEKSGEKNYGQNRIKQDIE